MSGGEKKLMKGDPDALAPSSAIVSCIIELTMVTLSLLVPASRQGEAR